jgi:hypothetical protein
MSWDADTVSAIAAVAALAISLLALGVSWFFAARSSGTQNRLTTLQEKLTGLEEERRSEEKKQQEKQAQEAQLDISIQNYNDTEVDRRYEVHFTNRGPSDAWDVVYRVRWKEPAGWKSTAWDTLPPFNVPAPIQTRSATIPLASLPHALGFDIELKWSDNAHAAASAGNRFEFDAAGRALGKWR